MLSAMREKSTHRPQVDFISLAIQGKKIGLKGVIKMVDGMVATLKQEQKDEDTKKEYCSKELDFASDKKKGLAKTLSDLDISIQDATDGVATLKEEIESLTKKIKDLDQSVMEATEQRKSGHQEFTESMSSNSAAKELLKFAINRLNKFYNPKLAAPAFIASTGVTAFVEVSAHVHQQDAPPPPPATFDAYAGQKEESGGVMKMIDLLVNDLDKTMQEAEFEEKESQKDYEQMLQDSADKRALDSKALTDKNIAKASMESDVEASKEAKSSTGTELMATDKYLSSLHGECDFLLKFFDVRKEARTGEVDALVNAKSVLLGADLSLLQQQQNSHNLRKRSGSV
jgi:chromosome segregation ATPase